MYIRVVNIINNIWYWVASVLNFFADKWWSGSNFDNSIAKALQNFRFVTIADGLCPDLENWYFAPVKQNFKHKIRKKEINLLKQTLTNLESGGEDNDNELSDKTSIDAINKENEEDVICLTVKTDYLMSCIEMALAQEYKVINFL